MDKKNENEYQDIINLPHHVSPTRTQMSILDRAAQFSPFAALTGYENAIEKATKKHIYEMEKREGEIVYEDYGEYMSEGAEV